MRQQHIVLDRLFSMPAKKVWHAITDQEQIRNWYFSITEFRPEIGFTFRFTGGVGAGTVYQHICQVTDVIPERKLSYNWSYKGIEGNSSVMFELFEMEQQTLLKLTHTGLETFPDSHPDLSASHFEQDWNHLIHGSLSSYLQDKDYRHGITTGTPAESVYESLTRQIGKWWSVTFEGVSDQAGGIFTVRFGTTYKTMRVSGLVPDKRVTWQVTDAHIDLLDFADKGEWIGTQIIWDIETQGDHTKLALTHVGLNRDFECYEVCEKGWIHFLQSLFLYLTTGTGQPFGTINA